MRKTIIMLAVCAVSATAVFCAAYGQSEKYIKRLRAADRHIKLLKEVEDAIDSIRKDRVPKLRRWEMHIFNITDLLIETRLPDFSPPSPFVQDVEYGCSGAGGGITFNGDENSSDDGYDPDDLVNLIKYRTGYYNWPEEEDGFGTINFNLGKLLVINTPAMIEKVGRVIEELRANLPDLVLSRVYLFAADEAYLKQLRDKEASVLSPDAVKKILSDSAGVEKVRMLKSGYLTAYSSQAAYLYCGTIHTYQGDTDTSGAGGLTPIEIFDPVINIFREGLIVGLRAHYNRQTDRVSLIAMISLSRLTEFEEHTGIGGGFCGPQEAHGVSKCTVETPKVDLQTVTGSSRVPPGHGLLLGGSKMKTAQDELKSFVVLIVPDVQK